MGSKKQAQKLAKEREFKDAFNAVQTQLSNRTNSILSQFEPKNVLNNDNRLFTLKAQLSQRELSNSYQNHFIVNKCINLIVERMFKNGMTFIFEDTEAQKQQEEFEKDYRRNYVPIMKKSIEEALIYGGGLILKQDTKQATTQVYSKSSDTTMYHIPRAMYSTLPSYIPNTTIANGVSQFILGSYNQNYINKNFGVYTTSTGKRTKHKSALESSFFIQFDGLNVPYEYFNSVYQYQGGSLIAPNIDNIKTDTIILENIGNLVFRNGVLIFKRKDLIQKLNGTEEEILNAMKRNEVLNSGINSTSMAIIDVEEEIEALGASLDGLDELSINILKRMVGYFGLSLTDVLGEAPQGMNATGESDISHSVQTIEMWQEHFYKPVREVCDVAVQIFFKAKDEIKYQVEFNSPRVESKVEKADFEGKVIDNAIQRTLAMEDDKNLEYLEKNGIITSEEKAQAKIDNKQAKIDFENDDEKDKNNKSK